MQPTARPLYPLPHAVHSFLLFGGPSWEFKYSDFIRQISGTLNWYREEWGNDYNPGLYVVTSVGHCARFSNKGPDRQLLSSYRGATSFLSHDARPSAYKEGGFSFREECVQDPCERGWRSKPHCPLVDKASLRDINREVREKRHTSFKTSEQKESSSVHGDPRP